MSTEPFVKLAIIGSGPSAFYAATRALTAPTASGSARTAVHIYESLPTPFGLVRAGVAPDHPDVKNVTHRFTEVVREASARSAFRFFGNVKVVAGPTAQSQTTAGKGKQTAVELPLEELLRHYTHIVLAYGSARARTLGSGVSGQDLRGVCSALDFVNWYNGHPDAHAQHHGGTTSLPWLDVVRPGARHVSVIGAGNVALDVARIILRARQPTSSFLASTDIPSSVLECSLGNPSINQIEHVSIVARRGVAQVAFTNKEVREMLTLGETEGIDFVPLSKEMTDLALADVVRLKQISDQTAADLKQGNFGTLTQEAFAKHASELAGELRIRKRLVDLLIKGSKRPKASEIFGARKSWSVEPFRAPEAILPSSAESPDRVGHIRWAVTEPISHSPSESNPSASTSPAPTDASQNPTWGGGVPPATSPPSPQWGAVRPTDQTITTDTDGVIYSLGYVGARLPPPSSSMNSGISSWQRLIPFDDRRKVIKNQKGVVEWDQEAATSLGLNLEKLPKLFATGWIGRGPVGVIASTMYDAYDVVDLMLSQTSSPTAPVDFDSIPSRVQDALLSNRIKDDSERAQLLTPRKLAADDALQVEGLAGAVTEWEDWEVLDKAELEAGATHQPTPKEREKVISFR
ncbi:NADPH-adrenodoxin reductase [Tilletia horrida]|uniref:NADPH-adrenodoxin reductase n=1 Tax=Tilletia horrida TaxID=155126 RepID=A0AAN6GU14_9BASI|nr:NADPH-adrenodoxin reductase [Tilletia horrida]KAK0557104.1 NADPH-adrenodoxin reductase [Tilletia horrida]